MRISRGRLLVVEGEVVEELSCAVDECLGGGGGFLGFVADSGVAGGVGVFEFVAASAQGAEWPEGVAELGADRVGDGGVPSGSGRAQALLGEQGGSGEPGGVVGQDVGAVGVGAGERGRADQGLSGVGQQRVPVGCGAGDPFEFAAGEESRDFSLAACAWHERWIH